MQIQGQGLFLLSMSSKQLTSTLSLTKLFSPPNGFYKEKKQDCKFRETIHMDKAITHRTGATYFHGLHPLMITGKTPVLYKEASVYLSSCLFPLRHHLSTPGRKTTMPLGRGFSLLPGSSVSQLLKLYWHCLYFGTSISQEFSISFICIIQLSEAFQSLQRVCIKVKWKNPDFRNTIKYSECSLSCSHLSISSYCYVHMLQSNEQHKNQGGNLSNTPNSCTSLQIMTAWI